MCSASVLSRGAAATCGTLRRNGLVPWRASSKRMSGTGGWGWPSSVRLGEHRWRNSSGFTAPLPVRPHPLRRGCGPLLLFILSTDAPDPDGADERWSAPSRALRSFVRWRPKKWARLLSRRTDAGFGDLAAHFAGCVDFSSTLQNSAGKSKPKPETAYLGLGRRPRGHVEWGRGWTSVTESDCNTGIAALGLDCHTACCSTICPPAEPPLR